MEISSQELAEKKNHRCNILEKLVVPFFKIIAVDDFVNRVHFETFYF